MKNLSPTVIPAHLGFKVAIFEPIGDNKISEKSRPEQFKPHFEPIIAWIITPAVSGEADRSHAEEISHADVVPVVADGVSLSDQQFIVNPDGGWSKVGYESFKDEKDACTYWINSQMSKNS
ncbi:hypothetical protein [Methylobacterium sp. 174MFSha1.1]|uniref:hypothetical protein n=1 Tax=Methylobacterium sp. 174MFSha1.1 TaxID=1502749 RepID=UPI00116022DC|nr:hypothetical protein [Methylobacterium sp. 174MFSha1.1]